jgi:dCTP deaminase
MANETAMIDPFAENRLRRNRISYGLSCYGYDFRLADEFRILRTDDRNPLDPKKIDETHFQSHKGRFCVLPPNSFALGRSLEYFRIPRDVLVLCQGKSTYARCGIVVNVTPFEPEWEGYATVSVVNASPLPVKIYAGEGIAQIIFLRAESPCRTSYSDRKGKYQAPKKIQLSRV